MYGRYAGLIFGMNGTILDTGPTYRKAWHEALGHYGPRLDERAMVALDGSPTWRIMQSAIELSHTDLDPHALAREETDKMRNMLLDNVQPSPLVSAAKTWYGRHSMSVDTGSKSATAEVLLVHLSLRHYSDAIVAVGHVQHHKPAPDTLLLCAKHVGVVPARCVIFGDANFGMQAIHTAGMDAVNVRLL